MVVSRECHWVKDLMRDLTPPILWRTLSKLWAVPGGRTREWAYIPEGWAYAKTHGEVKGWNVQEVLQVYKQKWPRYVAVVQGTGPLGVTHESDLTTNEDVDSHNTSMAFAYAIALAAHRSDTLSMLDWGGGIGHYYVLARTLLPDVEIDYHCKDVPLLVKYGAQLLPNQHFCVDESCLERTYDFVMASSAMHYTEDWQGLLAGLGRATRGYLYVTRLPTVLNAPSFVFVQRPYSYGYNTEYLGWCLNRAEFVGEAERLGLTMAREFILAERPPIANAPERCQCRGFLFRPTYREA
jgi:putative methyltransferase (TIGR04325 family)